MCIDCIKTSSMIGLTLHTKLFLFHADCDRSVDCVFVLDQSGSVGRTNHGTAIQFIQNVVAFFSIQLNQTRIGFVAYSSNSHLEFDLSDYTTLSSLTTRIGNVNYRGGGTRTGRALNLAGNVLNPDLNYGARPDDDGIPKIVVLITGTRMAIRICLLSIIHAARCLVYD